MEWGTKHCQGFQIRLRATRLPSTVALTFASDLGPVAYFPRQGTQLVFFDVVVVPVYNKGEMKSGLLTENSW